MTMSLDFVQINQLSSNMQSASLVGIIIAKQDVRSVPSKRDNTERSVIGFTIKDSAGDIINGTGWGSITFANEFASQYHVGDCVQITNAQVQQNDPQTVDAFKPATACQFHLNLDERSTKIQMYDGDATALCQLFRIPNKPRNDFYTLDEVIYNGEQLNKSSINMLVVVQSVSDPTTIFTKVGKEVQKCDITVFDTTRCSFHITIWNSEYIQLACQWIPKQTILFLADALVAKNNFHKSMAASTTSKTIITINPAIDEAFDLYNYALTFEEPATASQNIHDINDIFTITDVKDMLNRMTGEETATGMVVAAFVRFDLDGPPTFVSIQCAYCKKRIVEDKNTCTNSVCILKGSSIDNAIVKFSIPVSLCDHTGRLDRCHISGKLAEELLQCSAKEFLSMTPENKTELKWKFLLECFNFYFQLEPRFTENTHFVRFIKVLPNDFTN